MRTFVIRNSAKVSLKRAIWTVSLLALSAGLLIAPSPKGVKLDLSSAEPVFCLERPLFAATPEIAIVEGGRKLLLGAGAMVTAGELLAAREVLAHQPQTLVLNGKGVAVGGSWSLNDVAQLAAGEVTIPSGVVGTYRVSPAGELKIPGTLHNYGTIRISSADAVDGSATICAGSIVNEGTVCSTGNLTIKSARVKNSGVIASQRNGINIDAGSNADIVIEAEGGTFDAASGQITIRDSSYAGQNSATIRGGNFLSNGLKIFSGNGNIIGSVGKLTGRLEAHAANTHLLASTPVLKVGDSISECDPTIVNTGGDVEINGALKAKENITVIASGNILAAGDAYIKNSDSSGRGRVPGTAITLVAGANVKLGGSARGGKNIQHGHNKAQVTLSDSQFATFDGPSTTGGSIILTNSTHEGPVVDSSSSLVAGPGNQVDGGDVVLAAYAGTAGGMIQLPTAETFGESIDARSKHGKGGNVTFIAGSGATGAASYSGSVLMSGAKLSLYTSQPATSDGKAMVFGTDGVVSSRNTLTYTSRDGVPCLAGGTSPLDNFHSIRIEETDAGTLSAQTTGNVSVISCTNGKPINMTESNVNSFGLFGGTGLSLSGDVKGSGGFHVSGVPYFCTNGHTVTCAYFELRGGSFKKKDLTIGPKTNIVTTVSNVNGGNITFEPSPGGDIILYSGGSMTTAAQEMMVPDYEGRKYSMQGDASYIGSHHAREKTPVPMKKIDVGGVVIFSVDPELKPGGIHLMSSGKDSAREVFNAKTIFRANSSDQTLIIDKDVEVVCSKDVHINCPNVTLNGKISAKSTNYNYKGPSGGGTIACAEGNLDLSSLGSLEFPGQNITILCAGDITDGGKPLVLNLSSRESAGNLNLLAGFAFNPVPKERSTGPCSEAFVLRPQQSGAGAIKLSHTCIETKGGLAGGSVHTYARGPISIDSINTLGDQINKTFPSESQCSGSVTMVGPGVMVRDIDASSGIQGFSPRVSITSAQPEIDGTMVVQGGTFGGGTFKIGARRGIIRADKVNASVGTVILDASGSAGAIAPCEITASRFYLSSGAGGIGTTSKPVDISSGGSVTVNAGEKGDVNLKGDSIWLTGNNAANKLKMVTGSQPLGLGPRAIINGRSSVTLESCGQYGSIRTSREPGLITTPELLLKTNGGAIGGNPPVYVSAKHVVTDTGKKGKGKVFIINSYSPNNTTQRARRK